MQSLDCRENSYHIHLNTLGFHGCGKEISQICPYPPCPINTSFSGTLLPSFHSTASYPPFWRRHCSRISRTPFKDLPRQPSGSSILSSPREEIAINFVVPEVNSPLLFSFILLLYSYSTANLFTKYFFFFFSVLSTFKPFTNWPIRS